MNNQLIVYTPKRNVKKVVLRVFLAIFISILIFGISAFSSALIFIRYKWNEPVHTIDSFLFFNT